MVLGIDQSFTKTALCLFSFEGELVDFKIIKTKGGKAVPFEARIIGITEEIEKYIEEKFVSIVIIEGLSLNKNSTTARPLAGLFYYILAMLFKKGIYYSSISPKEVKKDGTNNGNAKKEEMINALPEYIRNKFLEKYSKTTGLADLADAYFIGKSFFK